MPGGAFPPMGGVPAAANPYPSVAYPGPTPGAGQFPTPAANPYGGANSLSSPLNCNALHELAAQASLTHILWPVPEECVRLT